MKTSLRLGIFVMVILSLFITGCSTIDNQATPVETGETPQTQNPQVAPEYSRASDIYTEPGQPVAKDDTEIEETTQNTLVIQPASALEPGNAASFRVTYEGNPVADAVILMDGVEAGTTDIMGGISIVLPYMSEIKLEAMKADLYGVEICVITEEGDC